MEILLLITIIVVGAAALYVAATFNARTRQNFGPLMDDAARKISRNIEIASGELRGQFQVIADELRRNGAAAERLETASGELRQQLQAITDELRRSRELAGRLTTASEEQQQRLETASGELRQQLQAREDQLRTALAQLDQRVAGIGESLAQQITRISGIYRYFLRQETRDGSSAENDSLLLAMLEAESYVDDMGWGRWPQLYALTDQSSTDALIPVAHERLPEGDLIEVLAGIHWPADVVGCVLVIELAALPPRSEHDAPVDADAAGQWASARPDGRPARLAVGVCRSGEHKCGLRVKGEDEIQVRTELAGDLVTALLATF
jgi:hypothetical protein